MIPPLPPPGPRTLGVDVSVYQGTIDGAALYDAGARFVIARTGDGDKIDDRFAAHFDAARRAGLRRGAYHFLRPSTDFGRVRRQVEALLCATGELADLPPALDLEVTGGLSMAQVFDAVRVAADYAAELCGTAPLLYTYPAFAAVWPSWASDFPLWIAHYDVAAPRVPSPWRAWHFWQHSGSGSIAGVAGKCDLNFFAGDETALAAFCERRC